jgi:hypothetical protein
MESTDPSECLINPSFREEQADCGLETLVDRRQNAVLSASSVVYEGFFGLSRFLVSQTSIEDVADSQLLWETRNLKRQIEVPQGFLVLAKKSMCHPAEAKGYSRHFCRGTL